MPAYKAIFFLFVAEITVHHATISLIKAPHHKHFFILVLVLNTMLGADNLPLRDVEVDTVLHSNMMIKTTFG
jgi:hypothetical protein